MLMSWFMLSSGGTSTRRFGLLWGWLAVGEGWQLGWLRIQSLIAMVMSSKKDSGVESACLVLPPWSEGGNPHADEGSPSLGNISKYSASVNMATEVGRNLRLILTTSAVGPR